MKKKLLFVESNTTGTGMLALQNAKKLGYEPLFLTKSVERYEGLPEVECSVKVINTNSIKGLKDFIADINIENIGGITTTSDYYLETVAKLNQEFGFLGNSYESIKTCRNKGSFRKSLNEFDIKQPKYQIIDSLFELNKFASTINFPCIVKPADDSGSNNVRYCSNFEEVEELTKTILANKYNNRGQKKAQMVLIEEYVEGIEYSVEMYTWAGTTQCIGITEKKVIGFPYFVERQHLFPADIPKDIQIEIEDTVKQALKAVDFQYGASHSEVKWTPKGCSVIEVNPRLAGGMIPELIRYSTGVDLIEKQVLGAIGVSPNWNEIEYLYHTGIRFFTAENSGKVSNIKGMNDISKHSNVVGLDLKITPGSIVKPPENFSHRLGHVMVKGTTYKEVASVLDEVNEKIEIDIQEETTERMC